jgi:hypothetical protein
MQDMVFEFGQNKIVISSSGSMFQYRRYCGKGVVVQSTIISDQEEVAVGIFPIPPLWTPMQVARNVYLKFKSQVIIDQKSHEVIYSKIPLEIGVYSQSGDEEMMLDAFSLARQQFALYGPPDTGIVCRYNEAEVSAEEGKMEVKKYEEALVRIRINNTIDNVVKIGKVIIPMEGVVLEHAHDDTWVPGSAEMHLDVAFGRDIVSVRLANSRTKRADKTSARKKEETLSFLMDAGY